MSVDDLPIVQSINFRLRELLEHARQVKAATTIEPCLSSSDLEHHIHNIAQLDANGGPNSHGDVSVTEPNQYALETAARNIFYEKLASCEIDKPDFVDVWNLLDILQLCADHAQCDQSLVLWLVEELLDSQTIDGCRRVFDYLESRRERLITNSFNKNKQMIVLRSCNELLRRLSRAEDAVFCGRVFIFLFQSFPLGDKSSVNLRGEFHIENTTIFDPADLKPQQEESKMDIDSGIKHESAETLHAETPPEVAGIRDGGEASSGRAEDRRAKEGDEKVTVTISELSSTVVDGINSSDLYPVFWSLQHAFSNPTKLFLEAEFSLFKTALDLTVQKFKSVPKIPQAGEIRAGSKRKRGTENDQLASSFNPKYLTSRDLFELELSDLTFQRHVLVQALILLDFLLSLTPKAKKRLVELKAQKAMMYNYTLNDEDANWVTGMRATISSYLQEGSEGKFYYRMVDNVLSRDKNWVRWKVESCPPIEKPPTTTEAYLSARNGAKRASMNKKLRASPMGSLDLSFLSDTENMNGLNKLRIPARITAPTTEALLAEISVVDLDLEMATKKDKPALVEVRASKTWRALRIASKNRLSMFGHVDERDINSLRMLDPNFVSLPKPTDEKQNEGNGDVKDEADPKVESTTIHPAPKMFKPTTRP